MKKRKPSCQASLWNAYERIPRKRFLPQSIGCDKVFSRWIALLLFMPANFVIDKVFSAALKLRFNVCTTRNC